MEKLISLLSLALCCFAASAQPTSFGGITPGTTTREELKSLVKTDPDYLKLGDKDYELVHLKRPEKIVSIRLRNDVVYEVGVVYQVGDSISPTDGVKEALIAKYGQPKIKVGGIRTVNCQNKFGATFKRLEGRESQLWPVKDGVQGRIEYFAPNCAEDISETYVLSHVATVKTAEEESKEKERREVEKQRRKLDGAL